MTDRQHFLGGPGAGKDEAVTVRFAEKFAHSPQFMSVFHEGMNLVEETAAYLDGDGRMESRVLSRSGSLAYATESMRLTTRLMQLASWLLLQRAVNDGELTVEQARAEKNKVKLAGLATATQGAGWDALPERLRSLISRSLRLQERIRRLDGAHGPDGPPEVGNPVRDQIGLIANAFNAVMR